MTTPPNQTGKSERLVALGWKAAHNLVTYCVANWMQDTRSDAQAKALAQAGQMLADEIARAEPSEWLDVEWHSQKELVALIEQLQRERDEARQSGAQSLQLFSEYATKLKEMTKRYESKHWPEIIDATQALRRMRKSLKRAHATLQWLHNEYQCNPGRIGGEDLRQAISDAEAALASPLAQASNVKEEGDE